MSIGELPISISPNDGQKNMDMLSNTFLDRVGDSMGTLQDSGPEGRSFLDNNHNLFGYDGVVVRDGKIVSLINLDGDENVPNVSVGSEIVITGDSRGYVSSGHEPGNRVKVIRIIEPFYDAGNEIRSSDKILKVEGHGVIGWIKPSELDKAILKEDIEKEVQKLFRRSED